MRRIMLKAKLHQARVTACELDYEGSCAIDARLMEMAGILPFEQIQIYNISNGERLTTYAIKGDAGSGMISLNGAAAHKASVGDKIIICAYAEYEESELASHAPTLIYLDAQNQVTERKHAIPVQAA